MNPPKPTFPGILGRWMQWAHDSIMRNRVANVVGGDLVRGSDGVTIVVKPGKGGSAPAAKGVIFRGEYNSLLDYSQNDLVCVLGGNGIGTYICIKDCPSGTTAGAPWEGNYFMQLPMGSTVGNWS